MSKNEIVVATITWARNLEEEQALLSALRHLARRGLSVVVADGGSGPSFLLRLKELPKLTLVEAGRSDVFSQARLSLTAASEMGAEYVLYTEPDKEWFFEHALSEFVSAAQDFARAGVVFPSRSAESFATYPASQRYAESVINHLCAETTGIEADYSYGPMLIRRDLLPYTRMLWEDVGWGWRHFVFGVAHRLGRRLVPWPAELPCPPQQRDDSAAERLHRLRQLSENVRGLVSALGLIGKWEALTEEG